MAASLINALYMVLFGLGSALIAVLAKLSKAPPFQIAAFELWVSLLVSLPVALFREGLKTRHPWLHLIRSVSGTASLIFFLLPIPFLPIAGLMLLSNLAPLLVPFVALIWFKERVPLKLIGAILIGFLGVLVILRPGIMPLSLAMIEAIISSVALAIAFVALRALCNAGEGPWRTLFYFGLIGSLVVGPFALMQWQPLNLTTLLTLVAIGLIFASIQICAQSAFRRGAPAYLAPLTFLGIPFGALFDLLIWDVVPDWLFVVGAILIVCGCSLAIIFSRRRDHGR